MKTVEKENFAITNVQPSVVKVIKIANITEIIKFVRQFFELKNMTISSDTFLLNKRQMKRTKIKRGLTFKLIILIFSSVAIIFILIFLDNYHISKKMVEKNLKLNAELITKNIVFKAEKILGSVQEIPDNFSKSCLFVIKSS